MITSTKLLGAWSQQVEQPLTAAPTTLGPLIDSVWSQHSFPQPWSLQLGGISGMLLRGEAALDLPGTSLQRVLPLVKKSNQRLRSRKQGSPDLSSWGSLRVSGANASPGLT